MPRSQHTLPALGQQSSGLLLVSRSEVALAAAALVVAVTVVVAALALAVVSVPENMGEAS